MSGIPRHHRTGGPHTMLTRRTLLADLGRVTLGAVVLGPVLAGCGDTDDEAGGAGDGATPDGGSQDGASQDSAEETAGGGGSVTWEQASFGFVSAYVLVRDGEAAVFDTGTGDGVEQIADALAAVDLGWDALAHIVVSHRHGDHAGGIDQVAAEAPDAVLYAAMPDLDGFRDRVATAEEVADGDRVFGLRVVGTPGHTLGHISLFDEESGVLLSGDAIVRDRRIGGTTGEGIEASPPDFTEDAELARTSVGVLADLAPATILFGHGDPLSDDAATTLSAYADTL